MFGLKKRATTDEPIAHKLIFNAIPEVLDKSFYGYGIVCEDDGDSIMLYATNESFKTIFCAIYIGPSGFLFGKEVFIVHNPFYRKVGIYYDDNFQAVIDFYGKKCISRKNQCTGSNYWGNDVILPWTNDFYACIDKR